MPSDSDQRKKDESFDERYWDMASTSERDRWLRVFPDPMPPGHRLAFRWEHDKASGRLIVGVEKVPGVQIVVGPTDIGPSVGAVTVDLGRLGDADLATAAAELGVTFPKKANRAVKLALINEARARQQEPQPAA